MHSVQSLHYQVVIYSLIFFSVSQSVSQSGRQAGSQAGRQAGNKISISGQTIFPSVWTVGLCEKSKESNRNVESDSWWSLGWTTMLPSVMIIFLLLDIKKVYQTIQAYIEDLKQRDNNNNNKHK